MKTIILLCTVLALLAPAYVHARDSSSRFALEQQWKIQQAQQREEEARFKAAEAGAAKAIAIFERKPEINEVRSTYPR